MTAGSATMLVACFILLAMFIPDLLFAIRTGTAKVGRASPRRTIARHDRPAQYWANVIALALIIALSFIGVVWVVVSPGSFP